MQLVEDVMSNKRKMKELEDNLLYRLTSTKVNFSFCPQPSFSKNVQARGQNGGLSDKTQWVPLA